MARDKVQFEIESTLSIPTIGECLVKKIYKTDDDEYIEFKDLDNDQVLIRPAGLLSNEIIERRQKRPHSPIIFEGPLESYWFSVGFLAMYGTPELRTTPSTIEVVPDEYAEIAGNNANEEYIVYNPNTDTFTDNASITFKRPTSEVFKALDFPKNKEDNTMIRTSKNRFIIYNKDFIWTLFKIGFRAGPNHDIFKIREYLENYPAKYTQAFKKGYKS